MTTPRALQPFLALPQALRGAGFAVSPDQTIDFVASVELLGPRDMTDIWRAGRAIYAIPQDGAMELRLSADLRMWGYTEPDYDQDIASTIVSTTPGAFTEQFTIEAIEDAVGAKLVFNWGEYQWELLLRR